jgi:NTE family protein
VRVAVAFGGGGAKAFACCGAYQAIREAGHEIVHVAGTSMGAVVGAAVAAGLPPGDVESRIRSLAGLPGVRPPIWNVLRGVFAPSLLGEEPIRAAIEHLVPPTRFSELKIPLAVVASDLDSAELVVMRTDEYPLAEALYGSCALPVYFPPAVIDGRRLGDGGLRAVVPLAAVDDSAADMVVAVHTGPGFDEAVRRDGQAAIPALIRAHGEAIRVMMAAQVEEQHQQWNGTKLVWVRAVQEREATFAIKEAGRYIEAGYKKTREALTR